MEKHTKTLVVFLVMLGFVTGVLGGVGGIALIASSPTLQRSIGIKPGQGTNIPLPSTSKVENISVKEDSAVIDSVKKISPSVVSVVFTKNVEVINPFSFDPFSSQPKTSVQQQQGGGTGFIITSEGLIATNKHVADVDGADYTVITQDGKKYKAAVVAKDPLNDFAILKIDAKNLPTVEFGDSDDLDIGQRVIAIGNALGEFQNSVTVGVVSGKERNLTASDQTGSTPEQLEGLLQTDAAINEGNSGGPLINLKGQVIAIDTATAAKGQAEAIGFAIPINSVKIAISSFQKSGRIIRPYLGVSTTPVDEKIAAIRGIEAGKGALVIGDSENNIAAVVEGSPAKAAGVQEGDVILKINNDEVSQGRNSLRSLIAKYNPGDEINLHILRSGNQIDLKLKLAEVPG